MAENSKRALRAELRERRRIRTSTERAVSAAAITENLIDLSANLNARFIAAYLSTPDEPDTRDFLHWARDDQGIRVLLPVSRADGLLDWAPYDGDDEEVDILGMPKPTSELLGPIAINGVDLILVPAACVDRSGMRMGWVAATSTRPSVRWSAAPRSTLSSSTTNSSTRCPASATTCR